MFAQTLKFDRKRRDIKEALTADLKSTETALKPGSCPSPVAKHPETASNHDGQTVGYIAQGNTPNGWINEHAHRPLADKQIEAGVVAGRQDSAESQAVLQIGCQKDWVEEFMNESTDNQRVSDGSEESLKRKNCNGSTSECYQNGKTDIDIEAFDRDLKVLKTIDDGMKPSEGINDGIDVQSCVYDKKELMMSEEQASDKNLFEKTMERGFDRDNKLSLDNELKAENCSGGILKYPSFTHTLNSNEIHLEEDKSIFNKESIEQEKDQQVKSCRSSKLEDLTNESYFRDKACEISNIKENSCGLSINSIKYCTYSFNENLEVTDCERRRGKECAKITKISCFGALLLLISFCSLISISYASACIGSALNSTEVSIEKNSFTNYTNSYVYGVAPGRASNSLYYLYRAYNTETAIIRKVKSDNTQLWIASYLFSSYANSISVDLIETNVYISIASNVMRLNASTGALVSTNSFPITMNFNQASPLSTNAGFYIIGNRGNEFNMCKYLFSSSTTIQCQVVSSISVTYNSYLMISDTQLFLMGSDPNSPGNLYFNKMNFTSTSANWSSRLVCTSGSCNSRSSLSVLSTDILNIYSLFNYEQTIYFTMISVSTGMLSGSSYTSNLSNGYVNGLSLNGNILVSVLSFTDSYLMIYNTMTSVFSFKHFSISLQGCSIDYSSGRFLVFGSIYDFLISKGYTSKFTQQSLDCLPDSITDSTLSMSIVGSGSQNVTSIASMAIGVATSIAVTTSSYSSKTVEITSEFYPCGDSKRSSFEACDDGNVLNSDGCNSFCIVESGYSCYDPSPASPDVCDICGNSKRSQLENCDDGNIVNGDGCSSTCTIEDKFSCTGESATAKDTCKPICGDGYRISPEVCDDGNIAAGDGCSSTCTLESKFTCTGGSSTLADKCFTYCGDGNRLGSELCDDGNAVNGDGCSSNCTIENKFSCTGGSATTKDTCKPICGDGYKVSTEQCDDGNISDGDGCSSTCTIEAKFNCSGGTSATKDTCYSICGDGYRISLEQCDDGNLNNGDGCSSACVVEPNFKCSGGSSTAKDTCTAICGDGLRLGTEQCDDGNIINGDGCSLTCLIEAKYSCSGGTSKTKDICTPICGDGFRISIEQCDDGNIINGDGCSSTCIIESNFKCSGGSSTAKDTCTANCGDGIKIGAEECDDGNIINGDGCNSTCKLEQYYTCNKSSLSTFDICLPVCGDARRVGSELCDDGNLMNGDGCSSSCLIEPKFTCTGGTINTKDTCKTVCGDGYRLETEQCDDGNLVNGDGCSSNCKNEIYYSCSGGSSATKDQCNPICGDGHAVGSEQCDDSNTKDNDGCSATCMIESGYKCTNSQTVASYTCTPICGDGYRVGSEQCDDNNSIDGDGCSSDCKIEKYFECKDGSVDSMDICTVKCGDGYKVFSEECDDGNLNNNDGCSSACTTEQHFVCNGGSPTSKDTCYTVCGNGYRSGTELCDDGNLISDDGCSESCKVEDGFTCSGGSSIQKDVCKRNSVSVEESGDITYIFIILIMIVVLICSILFCGIGFVSLFRRIKKLPNAVEAEENKKFNPDESKGLIREVIQEYKKEFAKEDEENKRSFDDNSRLMINPNILPVYNAKFANWNYNIDMCRTGAFEEVKRRRFKDDLSETESQKERNEFNNQIDRECILCLNEINFAKKFEFITCKKCKFNIHKLCLDEWNKVIVDLKNRCICCKEKIC